MKASTVVGTVILVVLIVLVGGFYYVYERPAELATSEAVTATETVYVATTTVSYVATTTQKVVPAPKVPNTGVSQTATVYQSFPGPAYHNSTFGLTVPGSYSVTQSQNTYAGVPDSATYYFYQNGSLAFTINVFSKEQWNNIRIQETINKDAGNEAGTYFGEGFYLGENFTWIYSYIPGAYSVPSSVRFY